MAGQRQEKARKRPFSALIKKLASLRSSPHKSSQKKAAAPVTDSVATTDHPQRITFPDDTNRDGHSPHTANHEYKFPAQEDGSHNCDEDSALHRSDTQAVTIGDHANSEAGQSKSATTSATLGQGAGSIFSSSNHSQRSLTTTLTTIQSTAPSGHNHMMQPSGNQSTGQSGHAPAHSSQPSQSSTYFTHQYPTTPASAIPTHVAQSFLPTTYRSATANNLLSDNASVLTLASSSHNRRRRGSFDTDASVRAIPPSSQWGGSRESLPLSTLSTTTDLGQNASGGGGLYQQAANRPSMGGLASAERQSVYSSSGMNPNSTLLGSERNSLQAVSRSNTAGDAASLRGTGDARSIHTDGMSIRSGVHGRNDSIAGSINALSSGTSALKNGESAQDE